MNVKFERYTLVHLTQEDNDCIEWKFAIVLCIIIIRKTITSFTAGANSEVVLFLLVITTLKARLNYNLLK